VTLPARLDGERLAELLGEQHEYEGLDYKSILDLGEQRQLVEFVKDCGAMSAEGGYILVGADDLGTVTTGIPPADFRLFDEATLRGRVRRYLSDIEIRSAVHEFEGANVALIWIGPHPHGFAIFAADGQYVDGAGRSQTVFRQGDVYIRRGTATIRADQRDMEQLRLRFVEQERTRIRREWAADIASRGGQAFPPGTAARAALGWHLDTEEFLGAAIEHIRSGDTIPIRLPLASVKLTATELIAGGDNDALAQLLDQLVCLAALGMTVQVDWLFDEAVGGLAAVYEAGHDRFVQPLSAGTPAPVVWLETAVRVIALGGLAVRMERWHAVRALAVRPGEADKPTSLHRTWIRHALTQAARSNMFADERDGQAVQISVLVFARDAIDRLACLRPDLPAGSEALLDSVCQFDALAGVAALANGTDSNVYPSFGAFNEYRTEPALVRLIRDPVARQAIGPVDDQTLANALRYLDRSARSEFFMNWDQFYDVAINEFLASNPPAPRA
jgi:hypothetical protein